MVASPVLHQVQAELWPKWVDLKHRGVIKQSHLRIKSFPVDGSRARDYRAVDDRGRVLKSIPPVRATPTVCD